MEKEKEKEEDKPCSLWNMYYLGMEERQGLVHVLNFVNSHAPVVGFGQSLTRDDLQ